MKRSAIGFFWFLFIAVCARADTIAVWNFNNQTLVAADRGSGLMTTGFSSYAFNSGTTVNSRDGDPAGYALSLSGSSNNGGNLTWMVSTAGFDSILVSFAIQRSTTGFNNNQFQYTADGGASWVNFFPPFSPATGFALQTFDLSGIESLFDNPAAGFRIVFDGATSSGNNRIDNVAVTGSRMPEPPPPSQVPEPSSIALTAAGLAFSIAWKKKPKTIDDGCGSFRAGHKSSKHTER
jgi:hypothetical protein